MSTLLFSFIKKNNVESKAPEEVFKFEEVSERDVKVFAKVYSDTIEENEFNTANNPETMRYPHD